MDSTVNPSRGARRFGARARRNGPETQTLSLSQRAQLFFWELEDSLHSTRARRAVSPCQTQLHSTGRITCQRRLHTIASACDQVSSPRATHAPTPPTPTFVGPRLDRTCQVCRRGLLLFAVDGTRQADPGQHGSSQRCMAASQAGGFQGLGFPLPEGGRSSRDFSFLCALCMRRD